MYKVYNFEANFNQYLKSSKFPKKTQKKYLVFFRSFLNWISLNLRKNINLVGTKSFLPLLSQQSLEKYRLFLSAAKIPRTSIQLRIAILEDFHVYLKRNPNIISKKISNPIIAMEQSLIEEFLEELHEKGAGNSTIRSYRSDIRQFLTFLREENSREFS